MKIIGQYCLKTYNRFAGLIRSVRAPRTSGVSLPSGLNRDVVSFSSEAKAVSKLPFQPYIVDFADLKLLPDGVKIPKLDPQNLDADSLCLVHMTEYMPHNGRILSAREAMSLNGEVADVNNTVHFTLNQQVFSGLDTHWRQCKYAILMPFKAARQANPTPGFFEGVSSNLYSNGAVKIPEGSVILKHNDEIPIGQVRVSPYSEARGVKILETSEKLYDAFPRVFEKMGYTKADSGNILGAFNEKKSVRANEEYLTEVLNNHKGWVKFCKEQEINPILYPFSPNRLAESVINNLTLLKSQQQWLLDGYDFQKILLETIESIKTEAQKHGFFIGLDVDKLAEIIRKTKTPSDALKTIAKEMKIKPQYDLSTMHNINPKSLAIYVLHETTRMEHSARDSIDFFTKNLHELTIQDIKNQL